MEKEPWEELPIRNKVAMAEEIGEAIHYLHTGERIPCDLLIDDLKYRSLFLGVEIQQEVLIFAEQIAFQYDYDPWHRVTYNVEEAADKLIEALGFSPPPPFFKKP